MPQGASYILAALILALFATLAAVAWIRRALLGRGSLEQLVDLVTSSPNVELSERRIVDRIGREEGARSVTLHASDHRLPTELGPTELVIVERVGEAGTAVLHFDRAPSAEARRRIHRLLGVLGLHADRFRAIASAKRHHEEARGLELEAMVHAERTAEFARRQDAVLEVIPDGIAVTDDRGEIVRMNAIGREIVGVPDSEPNTRQSLDDATNPLLQALREGTTLSGLEVAIPGSTTPRIIQVKVSKLSEELESRAAVALFRDVTHELLLEHDLRRKGHELEQHVTALERATRLKSDFLANMSHELRTPLNAVIGFTEVLLDGTYGSLNDRQKLCAGDVVAAGRHLLALINDILDLSKIEAGRMELAQEDVDLAELTIQALTFVRPQAQAKEITLHPNVEAGRFTLRGDPDRLRQVLVNLLSNAVKFTPRSGQVSVSARVDIGAFARVSVTDTGVGIADEERGKLFKEFSQIDGSVTRKFGGTGLGLAICKRLVELHGGAIDFTSAVGKGSTFFFDIPLGVPPEPPSRPASRALPALTRAPITLAEGARASSATASPAAAPASAPGIAPATLAASAPTRKVTPWTALIVDASAEDAAAVSSTLEREGFAVRVAGTLAEARDAAMTARLIIVELDRPDGDGLQLLRELSGQNKALVVLTERELDTKTTTALEEHAQLVLRKGSLSRAAFARQISEVCKGNGHRTRVLAVDDNEQNLRLITAVLARGGYDILEARDASTALRLARAELPDVILMDIMLPDVDGLSATRELKRGTSTQGIPVIAVTAQAMAGDEERAREAGCTDYVPKPINAQNLLRAIERAIGPHP